MKTIRVGDIIYEPRQNKILLVRHCGTDEWGQAAAFCATTMKEATGLSVRVYTAGLLFRSDAVKVGRL